MKKFIKIFICVLLVAVFAFSLYQIISILMSRYTAKTHYESYEKYVVISTSPTEQANVENNTSETITEEPKKITIDFESFVMEFPNAVGWIYSEGADLNYPVMQGKNNSYYIDHLPDGSRNSNGSLFVDFRNSSPEVDANYIIYGHNMNDGSMFGSITNYKNQEYYDRYPYLEFFTLEKDYKIELIAGCTVNVDSPVFDIDFDDENSINELISNSTFKSKTKYNKGDKLITLSTCSNVSEETRYILIGILSE